jgi:lipopolysaccharide assembly outer membrane protein LptD (OstA)
LIGYSYQGQALFTRTRTRTDGGSSLAERRGIQHGLSLNAAPKLGYLNVTPFFTYSEKWYDRSIRRAFNPTDSSVVETEERGFQAVRTFSMGVSAGTKLYGIVQPGVFGITGIRHQLTPSLTYTYQPDFSAPRFGYFGTYADVSGREVAYNRFEQEVFGGAPFGERQSLGLSVGNVLEMKTEGDSVGAENKFQLLNLNLGISYNFAADSLRFSELGMDFRTSLGQLLSIGGSARYNLYQFRTDPGNALLGRRVNRFLLSEEGRLADLTGFSISVGTRLSGEKRSTTAGPVLSEADSLAKAEKRGYTGLYDRETPDFSIPWNLDLTWSYNESRSDPRVTFRSSSIAARLGFNLTEHWKISASFNYDLLNRLVVAPLITVYRDLHCWEMNFSWVPTGFYRNYTLEIRLKAPQLRDIKVSKQASARGVF